MLGTRSATERLAQLLALMVEVDGRQREDGTVLCRRLTQEDLAKLVGSTRQWVSTTLERFCEAGLLEITPGHFVVRDKERLIALGA
jgi:CRP-like cAMP-binding protein